MEKELDDIIEKLTRMKGKNVLSSMESEKEIRSKGRKKSKKRKSSSPFRTSEH
jgi:hypothetical protein